MKQTFSRVLYKSSLYPCSYIHTIKFRIVNLQCMSSYLGLFEIFLLRNRLFCRLLYKSLYRYCLNIHNKVPYSCKFAVYVIIFGAVQDISVMKQAISRAIYKVGLYPFCLNTHNNVPYSYEVEVMSSYLGLFETSLL
jgi:hypothetical protein